MGKKLATILSHNVTNFVFFEMKPTLGPGIWLVFKKQHGHQP